MSLLWKLTYNYNLITIIKMTSILLSHTIKEVLAFDVVLVAG